MKRTKEMYKKERSNSNTSKFNNRLTKNGNKANLELFGSTLYSDTFSLRSCH